MEINKRGFTLIEILIVIAIIAILASMVLVGLGPSQRVGRDARRLTDLRGVQTALQLYFSKCGYYPGTALSSPCGAFSVISSWTDLTAALTGSTIGVSQIPNDPSAGKNYYYKAKSDGSSYTIAADLEDTANSALQQSPKGADVNGMDCSVSGRYCIEF